jgi:hypothetical protein
MGDAATPSAQRPRRDRARTSRLLLITGTPGTGKRALGHYLVLRHGFVHVDFDRAGARARLLAVRAAGPRDVVVTWSTYAREQPPDVRLLQRAGFEWIWFDGDRGAASPGHGARFARRPRFVDTFTPDGRFRPLEAVAAELLAPTSVRSPSVRERVRSLAPVAALAAGAPAAAAAAYLLVGGTGAPARPAHVALHPAHAKPAPALPRRGVLVTGRSLAGVKLGDTAADVRRLWGKRFAICHGCKPTTWFYTYSVDNPLGAGVKFRNGRVIAVFTLGSPRGWRSDRGIRVGTLLNPFNDPASTSRWVACAGYGAKSTRTGNAITSILTVGESVYGFALTRPSEPVCQ